MRLDKSITREGRVSGVGRGLRLKSGEGGAEGKKQAIFVRFRVQCNSCSKNTICYGKEAAAVELTG